MSNQLHSILVRCSPVVWLWLFLIYLNDAFLRSYFIYDSVFALCILVMLYFTYACFNIITTLFLKYGISISNENKKLREVQELRDRMFIMLVHDIKNPINRILFAAKSENINRGEIVESSKEMLLLVENILDIKRIDEFNQSLILSILPISIIVDKAIKQVEYLFEDKNLSVVKKIFIKADVEVDENLMERVIVNLLCNAIKYSKMNGRITIRITSPNDKVRVEVIDEGIGIATSNIDHVFDKFFNVNALNLGSTHSTGIGLTFCKLVIEAHCGVIGVKSQLGHGTTIWFELPAMSIEKMIFDELSHVRVISNEYIDNKDEMVIQCKLRISNFNVYQTGEILRILRTPSVNSCSPGFIRWKDEVVKSSMRGDVDNFKRLIGEYS